IVSNARLDLPEPESPVTTMRLSRGSSRETFLRLCTRAPCTAMVVRRATLAGAGFGLELIGWFGNVEKGQFLHVDVALFREPGGQGRLADTTLIGEILAHAGDTPNAEVSLEVIVNLSRRARFTDFLEVFDYGGEQDRRVTFHVGVDSSQGGLDRFSGLLVVEKVAVDQFEEGRVQF